MKVLLYILLAFQLVSWTCIIYSLFKCPESEELWEEENA